MAADRRRAILLKGVSRYIGHVPMEEHTSKSLWVAHNILNVEAGVKGGQPVIKRPYLRKNREKENTEFNVGDGSQKI